MSLFRRSAGRLVTLATRLLLAGAALAALLVPVPAFSGLSAVLAFFALPLPLLIARWPGSPWVGSLLLVSLLEWVATSLIEGPPPLALTVGYAVLLYLVHTLAAFADSLPGTGRVEPVLLLRALVRRLAVLAASVPLMLAVLLAPDVPGSPLLALAGALSALGVAALLVVLLHRRPAG